MLPNCWELIKCGREKGGRNAEKFGVCPAYPDNGHSCWTVAGTFCKGEIQGTYAQKERLCVVCDIYKLYSTSIGEKKKQFKEEYSEEFNACKEFLEHLGEEY